MDLHNEITVRQRAEAIMSNLPEDAVVFTHWWDTTTLQYLQIVEEQRPDVSLYNLFLAERTSTTPMLIQSLVTEGNRPVIFLADYGEDYIYGTQFTLELLWDDFPNANEDQVNGETGIYQVVELP